jgi:hypothetical protein
MKNKILLAILAIALVFGMTACNENGGGGVIPILKPSLLPAFQQKKPAM